MKTDPTKVYWLDSDSARDFDGSLVPDPDGFLLTVGSRRYVLPREMVLGAVVDPALVEAVESHAAAGVGARQEALQVLGEAVLAQLRGGG